MNNSFIVSHIFKNRIRRFLPLRYTKPRGVFRAQSIIYDGRGGFGTGIYMNPLFWDVLNMKLFSAFIFIFPISSAKVHGFTLLSIKNLKKTTKYSNILWQIMLREVFTDGQLNNYLAASIDIKRC